MEKSTEEELKAHLMDTNEEFRRLATDHSALDRQLTALEQRHHLTDSEQLEEVRLKKLKLRAKDQMMAILSRHKAQQVV